MPSSKPQTAETTFRQAFERLKASCPKVLPIGTPVSQNNVAKEAGKDSSALRKSRFPDLVAEIQAYVSTQQQHLPKSSRQHLLKTRQISRSNRETTANFKEERKQLTSRLTEAHEMIINLTREVRDLQLKLKDPHR